MKYYKQFKSPATHRSVDCFLRMFVSMLAAKGDSLLTFTDWDHYAESDMVAIQAIRASNGESRILKDSPHHWEGELMDFWTDDTRSESFLSGMLTQYELTETN